MEFLDLFSGIGGFRRGLERSGHKCVGHVEIDKYANISYMAMYGLSPCKYGKCGESNCCRICSKEVSEHCDGNQCKGEWFAKDIKQLTAGEIPRAEIWTFGFPCTDISLSGKRAGLAGERSGLFFTVAGLLKSTPAEDKPRILIIENVKHLLSSERGGDFTAVLFSLWEAGYDLEWQCVNSKDFGVPQHRERVYLVGYLGGIRGRKVFPISGSNTATVKKIIGGNQGSRVYDSDGLSVTLTAQGGGAGGKTGLYLCGTKKPDEWIECETPQCPYYSGMPIREATKQGYVIARHGDGINLSYPNSTFRRGRVGKQCAQTLMTGGNMGVLVCCRIRRLTPRECFRLQAFDDFLFDRAKAAGVSDAQLYKQAGNSVTVNIVYEIGLRLAEMEEYIFEI